MNKKDFGDTFKYFFKALLIAFIPAMIIIVLAEIYISNEIVKWLITFLVLGIAFLIALVAKLRKDAKAKEDPKKEKFDPFAD